MEVNVRYSKQKDFNDIFYLLSQVLPNKELDLYYLKEAFERDIESNSYEYICAEANGKVVGFCALSIVNNFWHEGLVSNIYALIVDSSLRGQKIGTTLLKKAFDISKLSGCKKVELDYGFSKEKDVDFYKKLGFQEEPYFFSKSLQEQL
ncbi:GNAT family N-acetyltransferase [Clostridium neuense]|uniref:GNAT family N-acetyltransferase n=1 Tax=Clostridium neuense TaxID=1728934 RepID=A0ABW8TIX3_9CLOT